MSKENAMSIKKWGTSAVLACSVMLVGAGFAPTAFGQCGTCAKASAAPCAEKPKKSCGLCGLCCKKDKPCAEKPKKSCGLCGLCCKKDKPCAKPAAKAPCPCSNGSAATTALPPSAEPGY